MDLAQKKGIKIDTQLLSKILNVNVFETQAKNNKGIDAIREAIFNNDFSVSNEVSFEIPLEQKSIISKLLANSTEKNEYKIWTLLSSEKNLAKLVSIGEELSTDEVKCVVPKRLQAQETVRRYQNIDKTIAQVLTKTQMFKDLLTDKLDKLLVHKFWGYIIFLGILLLIFQSVFFLAEFPMAWIESLFAWLSQITKEHLPHGPIASLISDGIIPGIGGIAVFAPQIGILMYFLYLLEDSGYMARVIFLMDRLLRPFGLNGKSIIPLVSGTACAIPAIMSTRNIENVKERLITILVTPFMTCSARLPVYSIIIGLIIPDEYFGGISYKALALTAMYLLGFFTALAISLVLKYIIKEKGKTYLVMDLPTYKVPLFGYDFKMALSKVWEFVIRAGKVIFMVSIIIWTLSYFGPSTAPNKFVETEVELKDSYLSKMGKAMEPAIAPLGYDWKMGVGIITSFAAREVFVGTISTLYSLSDDTSEDSLMDKMRNDVKADGTKVFSFATGISVLLFYAFAMQCISTVAIVYRETKSLKWTLFQMFGMTAIAILASFVAYQLIK
jgi:ferrous iron transport protein B